MNKVLIIGAAGFVGGYLIDHIQATCKWPISATKMPQEMITYNVDIIDLDILDKKAIKDVLLKTNPNYIFHLAAQSSVAVSWNNPAITVDINIKGSLNVLDAVKELNINPRILLIGSGEEYGYVHPNEIPILEETTLRPGNIYAATKACQNMIGRIYSQAYGMEIMMVRAFNHIGPNQSPVFVVADFCKQVAEIEHGKKEPIIYVGNLSAKRDFLDVRDVVHAYTLLMQYGIKGETYNVGSGKAVSIQQILEKILTIAKIDIKVETDTSKYRPIDVPIIEADISKLVNNTNWSKKIDLDETIKETLTYWRNVCK